MDYCPRCHRHLNGALACPGCATPTAERVYRAKPFPQEPPPYVESPPVVREPVDEPESGVPASAPPEAAPEDVPEDAHGGHRAARKAHGRRARSKHRGIVLVLAACLGTVLLGVTVSELDSPALPWSGPAASSPDGQSVQTDKEATPEASEHSSPSDASSAPATETPQQPSASATPQHGPSDGATAAPAPTRPPAPDPKPSSTAPPPPDTHHPDPPDDHTHCWLIICTS